MQAHDTIDTDDLQQIVRHEITDAVDYVEQEIGPERAESTRYYRGDLFGNEEDGRSQVVSRDVRDAVQRILASILDVFFGSERAVEYIPTNAEDAASAQQATDYITDVVLNQDNPGFSVFLSAFKDSLYNKVGIVKWWADDSTEVTYHELSGLDDAALGMVLGEAGVELMNASSTYDEQALPVAMQQGVPIDVVPQMHDVTVRRTQSEPRIKIMAVPPEEFLIDRHAKDIDSARYVGHRTFKSFSELVAMGYDPEFLEEHTSNAEAFVDSPETRARYREDYIPLDPKNPGERPILYIESYVRVDMDDDQIGELRRVCTLGESYEIVDNEAVSERPFASFCPDPEPHLFYGSDIADQTKDIQLIASNIKRSTLDSLAFSIFPRTAYVEGQVEVEDVLNTEIGASIRMRQPGMVQPFVGKEALPILQMLMAEKDSRIGEHNMALEADALQSTTKSAVNAQVEAATKRLKMIARIYAETGMKRVMKGLLRLVASHQDRARTVRLRNEWVDVDPASWNASMDVSVNVGLGHGLTEDRMAALREILGVQQWAMQTLGPSNPLVGLGQVRNTLGKLAELGGYKDTAQFYNPLPPDYQVPPPEPQPSEAEIFAQVEGQKTQQKQAEAEMDAALKREEMYLDAGLKKAELEAQYNKAIDVELVRGAVNADE